MEHRSPGLIIEVQDGTSKSKFVGPICGCGLLAQNQPQTPLFRGGVDFVQLDVSVYDKDHRPVKGLPADRFTLAPSPPSGPREVLAPLVPLTPTTRRTFKASDRVTAFARLYSPPNQPLPVSLQIRVRDDRDRIALERVDAIPLTKTLTTRSADVRVELPTSTLLPGAYLLTLDASIAKDAKATAHREVRFAVR